MPQRRAHRKNWPLLIFLCFTLLLPGHPLPVAYAAPSAGPAVNYASTANTIYIGSDSGAPPASQPITIPALAAALATQGHNNLVVNQGNGAWLVKANLVISTTAELQATNATITELRLDSPPIDVATQDSLNLAVKRQGHLKIDHIKVTSWDSAANTVDTNLTNGRSYIVALNGGVLDVSASEIAYLGYANGQPSGLSWRERLNDADPTTGSTGSLQDSNVHDNYFGLYAYAAYNVKILRNKVHDNAGYGIDPHTGSQLFEVAFNEVYNNKFHGIIFSRDCILNSIHDNVSHDNAEHGIMLDRGSNNNTVTGNEVYHNQDGFSVFESSNNTISNNKAHDNQLSGIRINATFAPSDPFDDVATDNQVVNNTISNNPQGIYLYNRADRNTIAGNTIISSTVNGIYIKSGGNLVQNNLIRNGAVGVSIVNDRYSAPAPAKPALDPPGQNNVLIGSTIRDNNDVGIRILGGVNNRIGVLPPSPTQKNSIINNGTDGISIANNPSVAGATANGNQVFGNTISNNKRHGVSIKDATNAQNQISQNSVTGNQGLGIRIDLGAQGGILPPVISAIQADGHTNGTARANAIVEVYSDPAGEGETYLGSATADNSGNWTFALPANQKAALVTALQTDPNHNSSAFTGKTGGALYAIGTDLHGQTTITVTGYAAVVTLAAIKAGLGISNTNTALLHCGNTALLQDLGSGKWRLNANLFIGPNVTLNLDPQDGVSEVQLCSQPSVAAGRATHVTIVQSDEAADVATVTNAIDYLSFVYLRTHSGNLNLDSVKVYSWDPVANTFDTDISNGRAYVIAKYAATLNIYNAELSYLGSTDGESYGVAWRDLNDTTAPDVLRTRVTGEVINSNFHHNYHGIYTFQAGNMVFRGNQFHDNLHYGFDPHDFTHDVLVENNLAYNNGAHGFIISRGCNNFTFRNNQSYNNNNLDPLDQAQGFMFDPGSPNASSPQSPSHDNILENNVAYGNEGFGLRILGSNNNQVLNNHFYGNLKGVVVDTNSPSNLIDSNVITANRSYGLVTQETADNSTITNNTITGNGVVTPTDGIGIFIHSSNNLISSNVVNQNTQAGIAFYSAGIAILNNQVLSNTTSGNGVNGIDLRNVIKTLVQGNVAENNLGQGIYLSGGASQNAVIHNLIHANQGFGVQANAATTRNNTWSENQIYGNFKGGISLSNSANLNLAAPQLLGVVNNVVTGKANAGATVELFSDNGRQGQFFEQRTTAGADGSFTFTLPPNGPGANLTAVMVDAQGNASPFSQPIPRGGGAPLPTDTPTATETPTGTTTPVTITPPPSTPTPTATVTPTGTPIGTSQSNKLYLPTIRR